MLRRTLMRFVKSIPRLYDSLKFWEIRVNLMRGKLHEPDFAAFAALPADALFLDVGANMGQSAVSLRSVHKSARIVSFEPNPTLEKPLRRIAAAVGRTKVHMVALGDAEGEAVLRIPIADSGTEFSQAATLKPGDVDAPVAERELGGVAGLAEVRVPVCTLDSFGFDPAAIKIDVQGYELEVLRGARETLQRARPLLLIERGGGRRRRRNATSSLSDTRPRSGPTEPLCRTPGPPSISLL